MHDRTVLAPTDLLKEREAQSLTILLLLALALLAIEAAKVTIEIARRPDDNVRVVPVALYVGASVAIVVALLAALRKRRSIRVVGTLVAALGAIFTAVITLMMWTGYSSDLPLSLVTKMPVASAGLTVVAVMTLTLRPLYVSTAGIGALLTVTCFYLLAIDDESTRMAARGADTYVSPAVSTTRFIGEILFILGATTCAAFATHLARRTVLETAALQQTTDRLSRYFSPAVVDRILRQTDGAARPGGREQDVVVMFSDIADFTRMCARLTPTQALGLVSEYQERMVAEIFKAGGTLDKFIGDGIMATFGTPDPSPDAADRAVRAARGMMTALTRLNDERAERGEPPLTQRIGVHAGRAVVGNVGTSQRLEFTVIGDTVNIASRVQAACKRTGRTAMISAAVAQRLGAAVALDPVGPVVLDGQPRSTELFALVE